MIGVEAEWYMPPEPYCCPECGVEGVEWEWECDPDANAQWRQAQLCKECEEAQED